MRLSDYLLSQMELRELENSEHLGMERMFLKGEKKEDLRKNTYFACSFVIHSLTFNFSSEVHAPVLVQSCRIISKVIIDQMRNKLEVQIPCMPQQNREFVHFRSILMIHRTLSLGDAFSEVADCCLCHGCPNGHNKCIMCLFEITQQVFYWS